VWWLLYGELGERGVVAGRWIRGQRLPPVLTFTWLTPAAPAAIAVVRCTPAAALVRRWPSLGAVGLVYLRAVNGTVVDQALAVHVEEGIMELHVHGGPGMRAAVSNALVDHGFREVASSEDASGDVLWSHLAKASSPAAVSWLLRRPDHVPPFPERFLSSPPLVLITGPANAGKSTLLNRCCGYQRALVSDVPGTTRDLVAAEVVFAGWRLRLLDSAGLRDSDDALERAGQDLVAAARARADMVVYLHPVDHPHAPPVGEDVLLVYGKADLGGVPAGALAWSDRGEAPESNRSTLLTALCERLLLPLFASYGSEMKR
jgi:tRNA U34 5-carboxymethylaminomethyl modifying GTPase MnmE/TrmE